MLHSRKTRFRRLKQLAVLGQMPFHLRQAWLLRYFWKHDYPTIGAAMELPTDEARRLVHDATVFMAERMIRYGG